MTLPNFLIIGAMKCGTSAALYNLCLHPQVWMVSWETRRKLGFLNRSGELHFFDDQKNWSQGLGWYEQFFEQGRGYLAVGEKTPTYLLSSDAHRRMARTLPEAKLIVLLRNPTERAYSHWRHLVQERPRWDRQRLGGRSFRDAVDLSFETKEEVKLQRWNLVVRGCYIDQLEGLLQWYPREQLLVCLSELVRDDMVAQYSRMHEFLGLTPMADANYLEVHVRDASGVRRAPLDRLSRTRLAIETELPAMDAHTRARLDSFYQPYNARLTRFLGLDAPLWQE